MTFEVNVLIPMAGEGSRFRNKGWQRPKPFIDVAGKPMIEWVLENLRGSPGTVKANIIVVIRRHHDELYNMSNELRKIEPGIQVVYAEALTEGAACTCLLAKDIIDSKIPLLIANADQFVEWDADAFWKQCEEEIAQGVAGNILCFKRDMALNDTKWSYAKVDPQGYMTDVQEKVVISDNATVGIYFWSSGADYVRLANAMIDADIRVKGEFYVAPVYNMGIKEGAKYKLSFCDAMHGLGVPLDLTEFLYNYVRPRRISASAASAADAAASMAAQGPYAPRLIAHRANLHGSKSATENQPADIKSALDQGFDVEIDVWHKPESGEWWLGHDEPEYRVDYGFLLQSGLWIHCKNQEALVVLSQDSRIHCFFHDVDEVTLTSKNYLWTYPDKPLHGSKAVAVMFSKPEELIEKRVPVAGICADNVAELRALLQRPTSPSSSEGEIAALKARVQYQGQAKALVFDLDGVLVESKDLHYDALNMALAEVGSEYVIPREEHLAIYDGLSTRQKLKLLASYKSLPASSFEQVFKSKQAHTQRMFHEQIKVAEPIRDTFIALKALGFPIGVASNCIRSSVVTLLELLGLMPHVDAYFSNEDVANPKPAGDIYVKAADAFGVSATDVLVIEDNAKGFTAATQAGANLFRVKNPHEVTLKNLLSAVVKAESKAGPDVHVVIPAARAGQMYWMDGPDGVPGSSMNLIADIGGKPLVSWIWRNIHSPGVDTKVSLLARSEHVDRYNLHPLLARATDFVPSEVVPVIGDRAGALSTVMIMEDSLNVDTPLVIHDGGHTVVWPENGNGTGLAALMAELDRHEADAMLVTTTSHDKRYSYVRTQHGTNLVTEVREKQVFTSTACVGTYVWRRGSDFVRAANLVKERKETVNAQYYIVSSFNAALDLGMKVINYPVPSMTSLRSTNELETFSRYVVPHFADEELLSIYAEMKERNTAKVLAAGGLPGDAELKKEVDERLCMAAYSMAGPDNWSPSPAFPKLMKEIQDVIGPNHVVYGPTNDARANDVLFGGLHSTLMQLISFKAYPMVTIPDNYAKFVTGTVVNGIPRFDIVFDQLVVTPSSILILGLPSADVNTFRVRLRHEMSRAGLLVAEPYKMDIVHATLVRFTEPLSQSQVESLVKTVKSFDRKFLGKLVVDHYSVGPATWKMQPGELGAQAKSTATTQLSN